MSEVITIKPFKTLTKAGNKVIINRINSEDYTKYHGYIVNEDGSETRAIWQSNGMKCNGGPLQNIDVNDEELKAIIESAKMMWEK